MESMNAFLPSAVVAMVGFAMAGTLFAGEEKAYVAKLSEKECRIDLGTLWDDREKAVTVALVNDTGREVAISRVKAACSCTVPKGWPPSIGAGVTREFSIGYTPRSTLTPVAANANVVMESSVGTFVVNLVGSVKPSMKVEGGGPLLETAEFQRTGNSVLREIGSLNGESMEAFAFESPSKVVLCRVVEKSEGGLTAKLEFSLNEHFKPAQKSVMETGVLRVTRSGKEVFIPIEIALENESRVLFRPRSANLGVIREPKTFTGHVEVENAALGKSFAITRAEVTEGGTVISMEELREGMFRIQYSVAADPEKMDRSARIRMTCHTNDAEMPAAYFDIVAAAANGKGCCGDVTANKTTRNDATKIEMRYEQ